MRTITTTREFDTEGNMLKEIVVTVEHADAPVTVKVTSAPVSTGSLAGAAITSRRMAQGFSYS